MELTGFFAKLVEIHYLGTIPLVVFILALIIRQPWKESLKGGIKIAIGALGMVALTYLAIEIFAPAVLGAASNIGGPMSEMTVVDAGWSSSVTALSSPMVWIKYIDFCSDKYWIDLDRSDKNTLCGFSRHVAWSMDWSGCLGGN